METGKQSWMNSIQEYFSDYRTWLTDIVIMGGAALITGVLLKNFGRYILGGILVAVITVLALNYSGLIAITFADILAKIGFTGVTSPAEFATALLDWMKLHIVGTISIIVGFVLGWKLG
jgi:hypothetical protein